MNKPTLFPLILLLCIICCHIPQKTYAEPFKIVGLGDSFMASTFSNSSGFRAAKDVPELSVKSAPRDISWIQKILFKMTSWPQYSFACGEKINSHYTKMKKYISDVECHNLAVPGDRSVDLSSFQCPKAAEMKPDYMIIEIGFNNIFNADKPEQIASAREFEFDIRKCIEQVRLKGNPYIVLIPLPDISDIRELIGDKKTIWWVTSKTIWNIAEFAPIVTDGEYKKEVSGKIAEYNEVLFKLQKEYGERVYFNRKCANVKIKPEHISRIDSLHPSKVGHEFMSDCSFPF